MNSEATLYNIYDEDKLDGTRPGTYSIKLEHWKAIIRGQQSINRFILTVWVVSDTRIVVENRYKVIRDIALLDCKNSAEAIRQCVKVRTGLEAGLLDYNAQEAND